MEGPAWLITGCSSGFGIELARIALRAGHRVIATSRKPQNTPELVKEVEEAGGKWLRLDVADSEPAVAKKCIHEAVEVFGRVDVLVNNAGTCLSGILEYLQEDQIKQQFETNFHGPLRLTQAVLPVMRKQRSGTIVNISSMAGLSALPSLSMYAASKHALEAMSESLSAEVRSFGIKVLLVEPGNFRTNVLNSAAEKAEAGVPEEYRDSEVAVVIGRLKSNHGTQQGDPILACQRIFEAVTRTGPFANRPWDLRLPLGDDCLKRIQAKIDMITKSIIDQADIARSTDLS